MIVLTSLCIWLSDYCVVHNNIIIIIFYIFILYYILLYFIYINIYNFYLKRIKRETGLGGIVYPG